MVAKDGLGAVLLLHPGLLFLRHDLWHPPDATTPDSVCALADVDSYFHAVRAALYPAGSQRVLVGCAPCQPFSKYTQGFETENDDKWSLLNHFGRLVGELKPDVVSMENVPELERHQVYDNFLATLRRLGYEVSTHKVYCPDYGLPQHRTRLVLFASQRGAIAITPPTHKTEEYLSVKSAIHHLPKLRAGQAYSADPLHRSSNLSPINRRRIVHSGPLL